MEKPLIGAESHDGIGDGEDNPYAPPRSQIGPAARPGDVRCPHCKNPLGYWTFVTSSIPVRMTCPLCKQAIYFHGTTLLTIALIVIAAIVGVASNWLSRYAFGSNDYAGMLIVMFLILAPIQLMLAAYLRRYGKPV